jgi:hypothetical protein
MTGAALPLLESEAGAARSRIVPPVFSGVAAGSAVSRLRVASL